MNAITGSPDSLACASASEEEDELDEVGPVGDAIVCPEEIFGVAADAVTPLLLVFVDQVRGVPQAEAPGAFDPIGIARAESLSVR